MIPPAPLPPLAALRAFESVARHGSFTRAAAELGMTQAAVSYQIKLLEERVGTPLFVRKPRQVVLTQSGRLLAPAVTEAFELIRAAYEQARGGDQGMLSITTTPTFASHWLAARIGSFQLAHPRLAVRLQTTSILEEFNSGEIDVAIRSGRGDWPGLAAHWLLASDFTPMLSPGLAETIGGVHHPADLLRLPIVAPDDPWWGIWLAAAGVPAESLRGLPRTLLGSQAYEAVAAIAGQGVAMLTPSFYAQEIADGRLLQPFDLVCSDDHPYWLVYPQGRRASPKIVAFRDWLLAAIAA
jgi:LysR family glycine cleavage system transcriptional activator